MTHNSKHKIIYEFKRIERWREEFNTSQIIKLFNEALNRPIDNQKDRKTIDIIPSAIRRKNVSDKLGCSKK